MTYDAVIVGAGISGLTCANILHQNTLSFIILESSDRAGGRIQTDTVEGTRMDRGFQVLQTGYPEAARSLDLKKLNLKKFPAGVAVRYSKKFHVIADPRRHPRYLLSTLFSPIGTAKDRFLMMKLANHVCRGSYEDIFVHEEQPTIDFLQNWGFSRGFIERFFVPFFAGACLDPEITATSRTLKYIFRVFTQGDAALPSHGMEEIPRQLAAALPSGSIRYKSKVVNIDSGCVTLEDGTTFSGQTVVLAISQDILADFFDEISPRPSVSEQCFYYLADWLPPFKEPFLLLNGEGSGPINNMAFPSLVAPEYSPSNKTLIAAVVLGRKHLEKKDLEKHVRAQCIDWFGSQAKVWEHIHTAYIDHALPLQEPPTANPYVLPDPVRKGVRIIGEHQSLPGTQWALLSGRLAAEAIISDQ